MLLIQFALRLGHARFGFADLSGQIQPGGLGHLVLDMEQVRRMMGAEVLFDMA